MNASFFTNRSQIMRFDLVQVAKFDSFGAIALEGIV
jgi:hypothetical protein